MSVDLGSETKSTDRKSANTILDEKIETVEAPTSVRNYESFENKIFVEDDEEFRLDFGTENFDEKKSQEVLHYDDIENRRKVSQPKRVRLSIDNKSIKPGVDIQPGTTTEDKDNIVKNTETGTERKSISSDVSVSLQSLDPVKDDSLIFDLHVEKSQSVKLLANTSMHTDFSLSGEDQQSLKMPSFTSLDTSTARNLSGTHLEPELEPKPELDINMYYEMMRIFNERKQLAKVTNDYLQQKMAAYYSKRKMFSVFKDDTSIIETAIYEKKLNIFDETYERTEREKSALENEISELTLKCDTKKEDLKSLHESLLQKLRDYGYGLTFSKTGKSNMERVTDRFLKIYNSLMNSLIRMRITYIKLKNKFNETEREINDMDNLGPGFSIMDYMQLKADNRVLQERLEEKETELMHLREDCKNVLQIVAHNREKNQLLELDVAKYSEEFIDKEADFTELREQVNFLKRERDILRSQTVQLKFDNGLLTFTPMLRDMLKDIEELDTVKQEIEEMKDKCQQFSLKNKIVRKNLENILKLKNENKLEQSKSHNSFVSDD